jgi:hypothetical protein
MAGRRTVCLPTNYRVIDYRKTADARGLLCAITWRYFTVSSGRVTVLSWKIPGLVLAL